MNSPDVTNTAATIPAVAPAAAAKAPKPVGLRDSTPYVVTDAREVIMYMADDYELARTLRGERIPVKDRRWKYARPGDVVRDLPAISVAPNLASGIIRKATAEDLKEGSA